MMASQYILLVSSDRNRFAAIAGALASRIDVELQAAANGDDALETVTQAPPLLAVIDEDLPDTDGLSLARRMTQANPLVNTVLVSSLSPEEFHEASEGLGVLLQLPVQPGEEDARAIVAALENIHAIPV